MHRAGRLTAKVNGREETGSNPARSVLENAKRRMPLRPHSPQSQRAEAGCPRLPRRMAKRTSVRAEPCTRGKMGRQASAQRQVASYEKAPFVRTAHCRLERTTGLMDALRAPLPLRLKPSGEFLKTAHWAVFLTEFHLIGSSPDSCSKTKTAGAIASAVRFLERTTGLEPATPTLARWCSTN